MNLAIVDDDADVRRALSRLLRCFGHTVQTFASAEEFEASCASVDCAVVDVRMPGLGGLELRKRLLSRPVPLPVVLISGDTDPKFADTLRATDTPSVTKPFDDATLMRAIATAVSSTLALRKSNAR